MKPRLIAFLILSMLASPALAEKLVFDHRLSPPLKAVIDGGDGAMIAYDASNPRYVTDLIAVRGKSAKDWTEALVIIARTPNRRIRTAADWVAELRGDADRRCPNRIAVVAEAANSITFERQSSGCAANYPAYALYRVVAGNKSLFLLGVMTRSELPAQSRSEWLTLLESAHLE